MCITPYQELRDPYDWNSMSATNSGADVDSATCDYASYSHRISNDGMLSALMGLRSLCVPHDSYKNCREFLCLQMNTTGVSFQTLVTMSSFLLA